LQYSYSSEVINGYQTSGNVYESTVCVGDNTCKISSIYAADSIQADDYMYNQNGAYGILGLGPLSPIWAD